MNPNDFLLWLSGYLDGKEKLNQKQIKRIKDKLSTVFHKVTPDVKPATNPFNDPISPWVKPYYPYIDPDKGDLPPIKL